jgi:hypothetical protein
MSQDPVLRVAGSEVAGQLAPHVVGRLRVGAPGHCNPGELERSHVRPVGDSGRQFVAQLGRHLRDEVGDTREKRGEAPVRGGLGPWHPATLFDDVEALSGGDQVVVVQQGLQRLHVVGFQPFAHQLQPPVDFTARFGQHGPGPRVDILDNLLGRREVHDALGQLLLGRPGLEFHERGQLRLRDHVETSQKGLAVVRCRTLAEALHTLHAPVGFLDGCMQAVPAGRLFRIAL